MQVILPYASTHLTGTSNSTGKASQAVRLEEEPCLQHACCNNLGGTIPASIGNLTALTSLCGCSPSIPLSPVIPSPASLPFSLNPPLLHSPWDLSFFLFVRFFSYASHSPLLPSPRLPSPLRPSPLRLPPSALPPSSPCSRAFIYSGLSGSLSEAISSLDQLQEL
ncbi:unnamed protein product [Closterium sp. Naga37s-1]|nr:unnamed protein product [Closterium sp. Naga37s-1]